MPHAVIDAYFRAMQAGASAGEDLLALFTDDAVYIEPFAGAVRTHRGKSAIRECFTTSWEAPLPDLELSVDRVDVDAEGVFARWTCRSPALPGPQRGEDRYVLRDGKIARLEVRLL